MTDSQLLAAIQADSQASALAAAGNDAGCAARIAATAAPVLVSTYVNERGVFAAFADPADAEHVMEALEALAPTNPVIKRALDWMQPNNGGIDLSFASVRTMLDQMAAGGAITTAQAGTLKALAQQPVNITAADVSRVLAPSRPGGRLGS
jgi:hypothetical protein